MAIVSPAFYEEKLITIYRAAYADLLERIGRKLARGSAAEYERALLGDVARILQQLDADMIKWVQEDLPQIYEGSVEATLNSFLEAGRNLPSFETSFARVNRQAVNVLARSMTTQLSAANTMAYQTVGRQVADVFRSVQLDVTAGKVASGQTVRQAKQRIVQRLTDQGLTAFIDTRGREHRLTSYAEMCARTVTREATNAGMSDTMQSLGEDLVQFSSHFGTCKTCAPYVGRVFSLTGRDSRYPRLSNVPGFDKGYQTIHPNCKHVLRPYIEEFDKDTAATMRRSNAPIKDSRTRSQVDAYDKAQKEKAQANADLRQYESYKAWLPEDAPKSFAGWRKMKNANSDRYKELQSMYREVRASGNQ